MHRLTSLLSRGEDAWYSESVGGRCESGTFTLRRPQPIRDVLALPALLLIVAAAAWTGWGVPVILAPLLVTGGVVLRTKELAVLMSAAAVVAAYASIAVRFALVDTVVVVVAAVVAVRLSRNRASVGIRGLRGAGMLTSLHDRVNLPRTAKPPKGWGLKTVASRRSQFSSSDFTVSYRDGDRLEIAVVDVSGKGLTAAMRATSMKGAFDGILGTVPPEMFLRACNRYLSRSESGDGFVSAAHLAIDVATGAYTITCAGHLPPVRLDSAAGIWSTSTARGVALGVLPEATYEPERGMLAPGEALMMFSDGLLGSRDLDEGVDRLLGDADCLLRMGLAAGAAHLAQRVNASRARDGVLALLWRS